MSQPRQASTGQAARFHCGNLVFVPAPPAPGNTGWAVAEIVTYRMVGDGDPQLLTVRFADGLFATIPAADCRPPALSRGEKAA